MDLYYHEISPNARKAGAVARHVGLPVSFIRVDLAKGEQRAPGYLKLNPNAKVPMLVDGETCVWESSAIMAYLADKAGSDLWPKDARQFEVLRWLAWDMNHFSRHGGALLFENSFRQKFGLGETRQDIAADALGFWRQFAGVLDAHLKGRRAIVGNGLTIADFSVAGFLPYAAEAKLPLGEFPEIVRWHSAMEAFDYWPNPFVGLKAAA